MDDFLIIGEVLEVRGKKVTVRVFTNKNNPYLVYEGNLIKNVSVGSFVKIGKGFSSIIGCIEGEYIKENLTVTDDKKHIRFSKESETIDRMIEVSIVGMLEGQKFYRGLVEIPLVFAEVSILSGSEIQKIFNHNDNNHFDIDIGSYFNYKEVDFKISANTLLASHIGIFGNTGSGKSNTLAKIYSECFQKFEKNNGIKKSRFIFIDFNGEYEQAFTDNKVVFKPSLYNTAYGNKNKTTGPDDSSIANNVSQQPATQISIPYSFLYDLETWSIICEATEKTQKPFLKRSLETYMRLTHVLKSPSFSHTSEDTEILAKKIYGMLYDILMKLFTNPQGFRAVFGKVQEILSICFDDISQSNQLVSKIGFKYKNFFICEAEIKDEWSFQMSIVHPMLEVFQTNNIVFKENFDNFDLLKICVLLKYTDCIITKSIAEEFIAPFLARFNSRLPQVKRLFAVEDNPPSNIVEVYSLIDVDVTFRKVIPLIVCKFAYEHQRKLSKDSGSLHIIIDEAHNILSTSSERESQTWKDYRLESFEEIIKEGRKFGTFLTISSQRPSDISATIISQLHNYFVHRLVNNEDLKAIAKSVSFIDQASSDMISVLPQGACIFAGIASNFPTIIQVDMLPKDKQPHSHTINLVNLWTKS